MYCILLLALLLLVNLKYLLIKHLLNIHQFISKRAKIYIYNIYTLHRAYLSVQANTQNSLFSFCKIICAAFCVCFGCLWSTWKEFVFFFITQHLRLTTNSKFELPTEIAPDNKTRIVWTGCL